jgi:NADPH2:quinone reductase
VLVISVGRFGGPEVLGPAWAPDPVPGPGEVVVAAGASDVMFVDTMIRSGRGVGFFPIRPPYVPGSGVGGDVISVGDGVDDGWLGRPVIAHTGGAGGGYAERAAVRLEDTVAVPDGLDPLLAAAIVHDGPTALRVARLVDVRPGEQVLVLGAAGGMGILLVQLLRARGARVIGAARGKAKADAVAEAGADAVIDYGQPGWTSLVLDATGGSGPAVVLDGVGGQLGLDAYGIIADGGRFSAHGAPGGGFAAIDPGDAGRRKVTVTGLGDLQVRPGERADLARELLPEVVSGRIRPLIGQTFPLAEAARAHTLIEARQAVAKTLLTSVLFGSLSPRSYSAGSLPGRRSRPGRGRRPKSAAQARRRASSARRRRASTATRRHSGTAGQHRDGDWRRRPVRRSRRPARPRPGTTRSRSTRTRPLTPPASRRRRRPGGSLVD